MKKMLLLLFPMLILVGCGKTAVPTWQPVTEGGRVYSIMIGVPSDAGQVSQSNGEKLYCHEGGEFEIRTKVFSAENVEKAVRYLTGTQGKKLSLSKFRRFDMPEYRFVWRCEEERKICTADLVMDGERCYAVMVSVDEDVSEKYHTLATEVFSTFGLFYDEGV